VLVFFPHAWVTSSLILPAFPSRISVIRARLAETVWRPLARPESETAPRTAKVPCCVSLSETTMVAFPASSNVDERDGVTTPGWWPLPDEVPAATTATKAAVPTAASWREFRIKRVPIP
jgi:hypothetical protein